MSYFRELIYNKGLYPQSFIKSFGTSDPQFVKDTYQRQELSLRHDMVCILLGNTTESSKYNDIEGMNSLAEGSSSSNNVNQMGEEEEKEIMEVENVIRNKRNRVEGEEGSIMQRIKMFKSTMEGPGTSVASIESRSMLEEELSLLEEYEQFNEEEDIEDFNIEEEEDQDIDKNFEVTMARQMTGDNKRYILLEGVGRAKEIQRMYCGAFLKNGTTKAYDLIDADNDVLIEIKVSVLDPEYHFEAVRNAVSDEEKEHLLVIVVHPTNGQITYSDDKWGKLPGEDMVKNFLSRRSIAMGELNIDDSLVDNTGPDIGDNSYFDPTLLMEVDQWVGEIMSNCDKEVLIPEVNFPKLVPFSKSTALKVLEDCNERSTPRARWNGKILPFSWTQALETEAKTDAEMIGNLISQCDFEEGESKLGIAVKQFFDLFNINPMSNFNYARVKKTGTKYKIFDNNNSIKTLPELQRLLGIGMKGKENGRMETLTYKQPEYASPPKLRPPEFMSKLLESESKKSGYISLPGFLVEECDNTHIMEEKAGEVCKKIAEWYKDIRASITMALLGGVASRLGGSYLIGVGNNTTHSTIAAMPIYARVMKLVNRNLVETRLVTGILIRGPHHVRDSTDKMNYISIQILQPNISSKWLKGEIFSLKNGKRILIQQNSTTKASTSFYKFSHNGLFLVAQLAGELLIRDPNLHGSDNNNVKWRKSLEEQVIKCEKFYKNRLAELGIYCMCAGRQEEGYMSSYRQMLMALIELHRGQEAKVFNLEEFIKGMNDCLMNNPWVLYLNEKVRLSLMD